MSGARGSANLGIAILCLSISSNGQLKPLPANIHLLSSFSKQSQDILKTQGTCIVAGPPSCTYTSCGRAHLAYTHKWSVMCTMCVASICRSTAPDWQCRDRGAVHQLCQGNLDSHMNTRFRLGIVQLAFISRRYLLYPLIKDARCKTIDCMTADHGEVVCTSIRHAC